MHRFFKGNGFLTTEGEQFISDFRYGLEQIMGSDDVHNMSEQELRVLLSNLQSRVGDAISKRISRNMQLENEMNAMTDEQFFAHLHEKYGDNWLLQGVEKQELHRLPNLQKIADENKYICESIREYMVEQGVRFKK